MSVSRWQDVFWMKSQKVETSFFAMDYSGDLVVGIFYDFFKDTPLEAIYIYTYSI